MNGFVSNRYNLAIKYILLNLELKEETNICGGQLERLLGKADICQKFLLSLNSAWLHAKE